MGKITTKHYSNGSTAMTVATDSDPPFDVSAAKRASLVVYASNFGAADNKVTCDVYWGVRTRGLIGVKSNITWEKDTTLTKDILSSATPANPVAGVLAIPQMKSKFMKTVFTPTGTTPAVRITAWLEQET